jgi:hypothetical protein
MSLRGPIAGVGVALLLAACGGGATGDSAVTAGATTVPATSDFGGLVTDSVGAPVAGVIVTAYLTNDHTEHTALTDATGHYRITGLMAVNQPGDYEVWAEKAGLAFLAANPGGAGRIIRVDHNALYRTVIDIPARNALTVTDANFTALHAGERVTSLPRTGQTTSFLPGDDGAAAQGLSWPAPRYSDNHDGTVSDALTGLVWLASGGCIAPSTWNTALDAAAQLAAGRCGLTDGSTAGQWRMPNSAELESLVDPSAANPALSPGNPITAVSGVYWSSTTYRGNTLNAWAIRFTDGRWINDSAGNVKASSLNGLLAVRSGPAAGRVSLPATGQFITYAGRDDGSLGVGLRLPYPRFLDNHNGTVSDTLTGLTWLKRADCIHQSWIGAVSSVTQLASGQCGLSDGSTAGQWRMPNRAEMLSLGDRAETNVALRFSTVFRNADGSIDQDIVFSGFNELEYFWTSTTDSSDPSRAWTVFSCDYGVYDIDKASVGYTLAVR